MQFSFFEELKKISVDTRNNKKLIKSKLQNFLLEYTKNKLKEFALTNFEEWCEIFYPDLIDNWLRKNHVINMLGVDDINVMMHHLINYFESEKLTVDANFHDGIIKSIIYKWENVSISLK